VLEALLGMNAGGVRRVRLVVNTRMALGGGWGMRIRSTWPASQLQMHGSCC
jgi:hypothetical protein